MGRLLLLPIIFFCLSMQSQEIETCPTITHSQQEFCDYVYDEAARAVRAAVINDLSIEIHEGKSVIWFSGNGDVLNGDYKLVDGETYYAGYDDGSCLSKPWVTVKVDRQPVAGRTSTVYVCSNSGPVEIYELMPMLTDGTGRMAEPGGTVKPALASGGTIFDPSKDIGGIRYAYTTADSQYGICGPDTARILINIVEGANAGEDAEAYFELIHSAKDLFSFINGNPEEGGTWSPPLEDGIFDPNVHAPGLYTYTVFGTGAACKDYSSSSTVNVSVNYTSTTVCHDGETILVKNNSLKGHLKHGDVLGGCDPQASIAVVSPNPGPGVFQITSENSDVKQVKVYDLNGGVLRNFNNHGQGKTMQIDISDLKQGIYFAEIRTNNGKQVGRIIKE